MWRWAWRCGGRYEMIRLNLLPPEARKAAKSASMAQLAALPWRQIGIAVAGLLVVYTVLLAVTVQRQKGQLSRLTSEWDTLQPEKVRLDETQAALQALRNRDAVLKALKAPEGQWAPRLNLLSDSIVADLWFRGVLFYATATTEMAEFLKGEASNLGLEGFGLPTADPGGEAASAPFTPQVMLRGFSIVTGKGAGSPVSRFLQRLKDNPEFPRWFKGVELKDVGHMQVGKQEVSEFAIVLYPTGQ